MKLLLLLLSALVCVSVAQDCFITATVDPPLTPVQITYLPTTGTCDGDLVTPLDFIREADGSVTIRCDSTTFCAFIIEPAPNEQATIGVPSVSGNCIGTTYNVPVVTEGAADCHGSCLCEVGADDVDYLVVGSVAYAFDPLCLVSSCSAPGTCGADNGKVITTVDPCAIEPATELLTAGPCTPECPSILPDPVQRFSVFVRGDVTTLPGTTDIEGRLAAGGNVRFGNTIGALIAGTETQQLSCEELAAFECYPWAAVIGGSAQLQGNVFGGDVYAGSFVNKQRNSTIKSAKSAKLDSIHFQCASFTPPTPNPINFAATFATLEALTETLYNQPNTGVVSSGSVNVVFRGTNTAGTEVFSTTCGNLALARTFSLQRINPDVSAIIINVDCPAGALYLQSVSMEAFAPYASRIIWNFGTSTATLDFASVGFRGTILAPNAAFTGQNGNIVGAIIAASYNGRYQVNLPNFEGCATLV